MKKIYINPNITIVNIQTLSMLANSTLGVSNVQVEQPTRTSVVRETPSGTMTKITNP